jgi:hypothetical protein
LEFLECRKTFRIIQATSDSFDIHISDVIVLAQNAPKTHQKARLEKPISNIKTKRQPLYIRMEAAKLSTMFSLKKCFIFSSKEL